MFPELPAVRIPASLTQAVARAGATESVADLLRTVNALPKAELHLHLDGSYRATTVSEMARRYEPDSPLCRDGWERDYWTFRNLAEFVLEFGQVGRSCVRTPEDVYRIASECFEDLRLQNVVYAEVSFGPRAPGRPHYIPIQDVIAAIDQARREAEAHGDFRAGIIAGLNRPRLSEPGADAARNAEAVVDAAARARDAGVNVIGVDLHGDEHTYPDVEPFVNAFGLAREAGLALRAHGGEASGAATVQASLDRLGVSRIAHGVRSVEDPDLVARLARERIPLDVCPTSNLLTSAVSSIHEHPLRELHEAGVLVSVHSDDPLVFDTSITAELALTYLHFGFDWDEMATLAANAAEASFLPPAERTALAGRIREAWLAARTRAR
jgi:adenosine deaminase